MQEAESLTETLEASTEHDGDGPFRVADLLDGLGDRSFGSVLIVLGIITMSPIGAIPGMPTVVGITTALIAGQLALGRKHPWIPRFLTNLQLDREKVEAMRAKSEGALEALDRVTEQRAVWATAPIARRIAAALCTALALLMVPLELIPFAAVLPSATITLFGVALTARDGLLMLFAFSTTVVVAYFAATWIM